MQHARYVAQCVEARDEESRLSRQGACGLVCLCWGSSHRSKQSLYYAVPQRGLHQILSSHVGGWG